MPKLDTSLWTNIERARIRIKNLATMVLSLAVINLYSAIANKSWILIAIDTLYGITMIPLFLSYGKWQKEPPVQKETEDE